MPRGVKGSGPVKPVAPRQHEWLTFEEGNEEWVALLLKHCKHCKKTWVDVPAPQGWQKIDWEARHGNDTCPVRDA